MGLWKFHFWVFCMKLANFKVHPNPRETVLLNVNISDTPPLSLLTDARTLVCLFIVYKPRFLKVNGGSIVADTKEYLRSNFYYRKGLC